MLRLHHTHKTILPWLSACKDLLQLSKSIVGVVPVLGSQLQALVETAELIVDKVEQIHREKEAEMNLTRKVCEIVRAIALALKENHEYLYEAESLKLDIFEVQSCLKQALDIIVAKEKKPFTNRRLNFGSKLSSSKELSDRLDEKLKLFTFKSLINICCVQSEILRRMAPSVASAAVPENPPPEYRIRGRDVATDGLHTYSNKKRTRSPSPAIPQGSRRRRTRPRLEEDRSTICKDNAREPAICDIKKTESGQKKCAKMKRTTRGRTKHSSGRTNASIMDVEDGNNVIDVTHHVPGNLKSFLGTGGDCSTLFQSTVSVWRNRQRSLSRERQKHEASGDLNVAHHRHDPSTSTSERIGDNEKRKAVYFHDLPGNTFKDIPESVAQPAKQIDA